MKLPHNPTKALGNLLITLSLIGLSYSLYPIIKSEFDFRLNRQVNLPVDSNYNISLPTISAAADIIPNVNPWDKADYQFALQSGVAHASGSATPDQFGTVYLFAHSSAAPWELARTNPAFFRLNRLELEDPIWLNYHGKNYQYQVVDTKIVRPEETQFLTNSTEDQLILQTCTPIGTDFKRLLVFAKRV